MARCDRLSPEIPCDGTAASGVLLRLGSTTACSLPSSLEGSWPPGRPWKPTTQEVTQQSTAPAAGGEAIRSSGNTQRQEVLKVCVS